MSGFQFRNTIEALQKYSYQDMRIPVFGAKMGKSLVTCNEYRRQKVLPSTTLLLFL